MSWKDLIVEPHDIPEPHELNPKQKWEHTAVVYVPAFCPLPTDMLRYDSCWPATGEDAAKMALATAHDQPLAIRVKRHCEDKRRPGWTPRRWASFGVRLQAAGAAIPIEVYRLVAGARRG